MARNTFKIHSCDTDGQAFAKYSKSPGERLSAPCECSSIPASSSKIRAACTHPYCCAQAVREAASESTLSTTTATKPPLVCMSFSGRSSTTFLATLSMSFSYSPFGM